MTIHPLQNCKAAALLALSLLLVPGAAVRAGESSDRRQLESHVHGAATMNVAVEGKRLYMEIASPAIDIVGFEHQPRTTEQRAAIERAIATLEEGRELFALPGAAGCRLMAATAATELIEAGEDAHHHHHHHGEKEAEVHSDFKATYRFECDRPQRLTQVGTKLFSSFPSLTEIDVQILTDSGQTAVELTPASPNFSL